MQRGHYLALQGLHHGDAKPYNYIAYITIILPGATRGRHGETKPYNVHQIFPNHYHCLVLQGLQHGDDKP